MSKLRISMKNIKEILHMHFIDNRSMKNIASITGVSYSTIRDNVVSAASKGLTWLQIEGMSEESLERVLSANDNQRPLPDCERIERELKRTGVTLQLLWQEYKEAHPNGYQYSGYLFFLNQALDRPLLRNI